MLKASVAELEEHFVQKGLISPLVLHVDEYYVESQTAVKVDVSHDFLRGGYGDGRRIGVAGTKLEVAIPFEGDPRLWRLRASTYSLSGYPEVEVGNGKITLVCTFPDDSADANVIRSRIDHDVRALVDAVGHLAQDVSAHNATVK